MQYLLTEEEYKKLKDGADGRATEREARHQAAVMATKWVEKAIEVFRTHPFGMMDRDELFLKRLREIKL